VPNTLVIGGCRSGKSGHALDLADQIKGRKRVFLATCVPYDEEMKARVAKHKAERSGSWTTVEVPIHLAEAIREHSGADLILVDCLTLWVTNLMLEMETADAFDMHVERLLMAMERARCPVLLVSNEVGQGIVPDNALARQFRDAAGLVNQKVAARVDRVVWMVAGIPVVIKGEGAVK